VDLSPLEEGVSALIAGDPLRAVRSLGEALQRRPFHPVIHFDLAVAYRLRGELPLALGHARLAMELGGTARAHALYALHLQLAHEPRQAWLHLARALELEPDYRLAAMSLGLLARAQGDLEQAHRWLQRALAAGAGELPVLVAERVRGQLFDLQRAPAVPAETPWCSVAAVTEILLADGTPRLLEPTLEPVSVSPSPAREVTAREVAQRVGEARRIVALTGAGTSAASGLYTRKELWKRFDRDAAVSAIGVRQDPGVLWTVVREFLGSGEHPPNAAHHALARMPGLAAIVTQNVDELHQRAALPGHEVPVHELHGTLSRMRCTSCGALDDEPASAYLASPTPPRCARCRAPLRPDVVLFGEQLPARALEAALEEVSRCDLLLVVGCAMDVAPASELPRLAAGRGAKVIELKRTPSRISDAIGSELLLGPAEETLHEVYLLLGALPPLPSCPPLSAPAPSHAPVILPFMGEGQDEVTLSRWLRAPGEAVRQGEPIAEFEADKVCVEVEAPVSGVLRSPRFQLSEQVRVQELIAEIEPMAVPAALVPVREPSHPLFTPMGPHAAAIRRAIEALDESSWLLPEEEPALCEEIAELLGAHARALHPEAPLPLVPWYSEDPDEVRARWREEWLVPGAGTLRALDPITLRWSRAFAERWPPRRERALPPDALAKVHRLAADRVERRMKELHGAELSRAHRRASSAIDALVQRWLDGLLARGQDLDPPCPAAPLLGVFRRGAWPFVLPGGTVGVFLPRRETLARCGPASPLARGPLRALAGLTQPPAG
jgi:NAD-dependent deacetylase